MAKKKGKDKKSKKGKKGKEPKAPKEPKEKKGKKGKKGKGKKEKKGGKGAPIAQETAAPLKVLKSATAVETPAAPVDTKPTCNRDLLPNDPCQIPTEGGCRPEVACKPNHYPGILCTPQAIAVVGSECGTYSSLCKLLHAGFRCADRVFAMTPWGNYVIFSSKGEHGCRIFFLFDGCCCNVNRFRYLDLACGTAGLLYFDKLHDVITYMIDSKKNRMKLKRIRKSVIDDICKEFCEYGGRHSVS